jgi:DNA-binding transcriptional MerR regulator
MTATEQAVAVDQPKCGPVCADHGPVLCICGRTQHDEPIADECPGFVPTYNAPQAVHLTGATYRQWDYWTKTGRIQPVIEARGSGTVRRYLAPELDKVRLVLGLLRLGFALNPAFEIATRLGTDDDYRAVIADIYEVVVRVRDTTSNEVANPEPPVEGDPA